MIVPDKYLIVRSNRHIARVDAYKTWLDIRVLSCNGKVDNLTDENLINQG